MPCMQFQLSRMAAHLPNLQADRPQAAASQSLRSETDRGPYGWGGIALVEPGPVGTPGPVAEAGSRARIPLRCHGGGEDNLELSEFDAFADAVLAVRAEIEALTYPPNERRSAV